MGDLKPYEHFTKKEAALVDYYCDPESPTYRNKLRSYEAAGYYWGQPKDGGPTDGRAARAAAVKANDIFKREHIQAEIARRQGEMSRAMQMSIEEVITKFSRIAGADLSSYLSRAECECPHCGGDISDRVQEWQFDINKMKRDGVGFLLKKMRPTKFGTEFEFHDATESLDRLMKHHGGYNKSRSKDDLSAFDEVITLARKNR